MQNNIMSPEALLNYAENFVEGENERIGTKAFDGQTITRLAEELARFQARGATQSIRNALNLLAAQAYQTAKNAGWYDREPLRPLERHALISSEVGEATEAWREHIPPFCKTVQSDVEGVKIWIDPSAGEDFFNCEGKPEGEFTELADVIIRIADYFGSLGPESLIKLGDAVAEKMYYNERREYRHGGKKA